MIHPTATVEFGAHLAEGVSVGAYAYIAKDVEIGADTSIGPHAVIEGPTRIGRGNTIHAHACLGGDPQDIGYQQEPN